MTLRYPANGAALVEMRRRGQIPELPVLVSLCGSLSFNNVTLSAHAGVRHDWTPLRALYIEVFASSRVPWPDLLQTLGDITAVVPDELVLTFHEGPRIHCGERRVVPHPDGGDFWLLDWFPTAIGPAHYRGAQQIARRLAREVGKSLPNPHDEAIALAVEVLREAHEPLEEIPATLLASDMVPTSRKPQRHPQIKRRWPDGPNNSRFDRLGSLRIRGR